MSVVVWVCAGLLGGVGALARFGLDAAVSARARTALPVGTLAVNISGAFALGLLAGAGVHGDALLLAGTAVLGSYTTFSTWMLESIRLGEDARTRLLGVNIVLSLVLGVAAAAAGDALGGLL